MRLIVLCHERGVLSLRQYGLGNRKLIFVELFLVGPPSLIHGLHETFPSSIGILPSLEVFA